jgi:putative FmdB family regulatory protein
MPIYEYECRDCGEQFEALIRGKEKPACPACGKRKLTKQFSVPAAHTSGSSPECPAREAGACDVSPGGCGGCGMTQLG